MNHVVVSERWRCRMCGQRLWLFFAPSGCDEDGHCDGSDCDAVFCPGGHQVPADMGEQVCDNADVEFQEALDSGLHMGEVWMTGEDRPPRAAGCIRPASILRWSFLSLLWCFLTGCVWTALLPPRRGPRPPHRDRVVLRGRDGRPCVPEGGTGHVPAPRGAGWEVGVKNALPMRPLHRRDEENRRPSVPPDNNQPDGPLPRLPEASRRRQEVRPL